MNYACDIDVFRGWADAVCLGRFRENVRAALQRRERLQAGARAPAASGASTGSTASRAGTATAIVWENLLPVGRAAAATGSRPWSRTASWWSATPTSTPRWRMADEFGSDVHLYAA